MQAGPKVHVTEAGVMSSTAGIFGYDTPKTVEDHRFDFEDIAETPTMHTGANNEQIAFLCGPKAGRLIVIDIGVGRGAFVPKLDPGRYGVEHTNIGNLLIKTKRIINVNNGTTSVIFGVAPEHWPDGINSCTLVQPDLDGRGPINLLADGSIQQIEPSRGFRFYSPFNHIPGAGGAFLTGDRKAKPGGVVYPPYRIGIMTLNRLQLSELLRGFNSNWSNGRVFAEQNAIGKEDHHTVSNDDDHDHDHKSRSIKKKKKEGLEHWL